MSRLLVDFTLSSRTREYASASPWHTIGSACMAVIH